MKLPVRPRWSACALRALAAVSAALAAACAAGGAEREDGSAALLVTLHDFKKDQRFELASESHTDRVEYYSKTRSDAVRKVQTDEVMDAFVDELGRLGFDAHEKSGRAPSARGGVIVYGLEVERGGSASHWLIGSGSAPGEIEAFRSCGKTFLDLYNITLSFQTVENPRGRELFEESRVKAAAGVPR